MSLRIDCELQAIKPDARWPRRVCGVGASGPTGSCDDNDE